MPQSKKKSIEHHSGSAVVFKPKEQSEEKVMGNERNKEKVNKNIAVNTANGEDIHSVAAVPQDKENGRYQLNVRGKYVEEYNPEKIEGYDEISNCDAALNVSALNNREAERIGAAVEENAEDINPSSLMDDISMARLNSVNSDILENNAININNSKNCTNDIHDRLNTAVSLVEMHSRGYHSLTNGSVESSHSTDVIKHINCPEVATEDATEILSDIKRYETIKDETLSLVESVEEFLDKEKTERIVGKPISDVSSNNSLMKSPAVQTETTTVNTNTYAKLKVPKINTKLPKLSTNFLRKTLQSPESENQEKDLKEALENLQKQNYISNYEMVLSRDQNKGTAHNKTSMSRLLIEQETFTTDKPELNIGSTFCKQNANLCYQTAKTESFTKKVSTGSSRIACIVRSSGSQNASANRFRNSNNLVGNQTVFNKNDLTEFSRIQSRRSATEGTGNGSVSSGINYGSHRKETGSNVDNAWKRKKKNTSDSPKYYPNRKYVASPIVTNTTGNFSMRNPVTLTKLQPPISSKPSSVECTSRCSVYEKSENEEKGSSVERSSPSDKNDRNKSNNRRTRKEQTKFSMDTRIVNGSNNKPNQGTINKEFSQQGSKAKIPGAHHMTHQNHFTSNNCRNENKPAAVSSFYFNTSAVVQKPKNNGPSKSMIPAPKSRSVRPSSSTNGIHIE